jgi:hypothetical protein
LYEFVSTEYPEPLAREAVEFNRKQQTNIWGRYRAENSLGWPVKRRAGRGGGLR